MNPWLLFCSALFGRGSSSLLCNCLKQLEFLAIHLPIDDRNDDAFHKALETPARVHRRGNLYMRLLLVFYRGHHKGRHDVLNRVDILLDQDPAWFWLTDTLVKALFYSKRFHFEADDRALAIASLLDLEIIQALFRKNIGVSMPVISDGSVNIFWTGIENGCRFHI